MRERRVSCLPSVRPSLRPCTGTTRRCTHSSNTPGQAADTKPTRYALIVTKLYDDYDDDLYIYISLSIYIYKSNFNLDTTNHRHYHRWSTNTSTTNSASEKRTATKTITTTIVIIIIIIIIVSSSIVAKEKEQLKKGTSEASKKTNQKCANK